MKRLMISAMGSDSGKTVVTCGLLALLKKRGFHVKSVKCGPDYIDPMFHSRVLGVEGANADLFLMGEKAVRRVVCGMDTEPLTAVEGAGGFRDGIGEKETEPLTAVEGAMGFRDGIGEKDTEPLAAVEGAMGFRDGIGEKDTEALTVVEGVMGFRDGIGEKDTEPLSAVEEAMGFRDGIGEKDTEPLSAVEETMGFHDGIGEKDTEALTVVEGAMGFYDGIGGTAENSAWDIADRTDTPVILLLRPHGQSLSLAVQVLGFLNYRKPSHICGLLLAECSPSLYSHLSPLLERETGLPVLGYLPAMKEAEIPSRHLGLITAEEVQDLKSRFDRIADQMELTVDVEKMLELAAADVGTEKAGIMVEDSVSGYTAADAGTKKAGIMVEDSVSGYMAADAGTGTADLTGEACRSGLPARNGAETFAENVSCRIAVAYDAAFCFYYRESLAALRKAGAELVFFSPLHDRKLPEHISGLYLGGGYPELYARELSQNKEMISEIRSVLKGDIPVVAECGGFLYLQKYLEDERGQVCEMVGAFAGTGRAAGHLVRFGYLRLKAENDSLLFRAGEVIPAHEFHHWDTDDNGEGLEAVRARGGRTFRCAYVSERMYAGFPHLSFVGEIPLAERFAERAGRSYFRER